MTRSRIIGVVLVAVLAATVIGGVFASGGDDDGGDTTTTSSTTSTTIDVPERESVEVEADPEFAIEQHPGPYRITYRLDDPNGAIPSETDRVEVRPPFDSRLETGPGLPPGGDTTSLQVATLDRLRIGGVADAATVARVPGLAPSAIRIVPVLEPALDAGLLEAREQRELIGRRCQVYRSGSTLGAGPLVPITDDEYADTCIDAAGIVLEETLVIGGIAAFRRTATDLDLDHVPADEAFDTGPISAPVDQGGGAVTPADPSSQPEGRFFELPDPSGGPAVPAGFERLGRYSVIPPQPEKFSDPTLRDEIIAGVVDVFADEAGDVLAIYQGGTLGQIPAFPTLDFAPTVAVDGPLGEGSLLLSALGTELRVALAGGRFVHVYGTVAPDVLVGLAESLVETEGDGLVLLDG